MRQRFGTAVLDGLDLLVELSTLGEYGLAGDGLPLATGGDASLRGEASSGPPFETSLGGEASSGRASDAHAWERDYGCLAAGGASAPPRLRGDCSPQPAQPPAPNGRRRVWQARP